MFISTVIYLGISDRIPADFSPCRSAPLDHY